MPKIYTNDSYMPVFQRGNVRYYILWGGRSGGRSYFMSQYITGRLRSKSYFRCAVMRFILGDVRNSIFQDVLDRIEEHNFLDVKVRDLELSCGSNTVKGLGFRKSSGDNSAKLKSLANFNCVAIEEADEVAYEDFMQLDDSLRTLKSDIKVFLLFNAPPKGHWLVTTFFNLVDSGVEGYYRGELKDSMKEKVCCIHTTFRDNIKNLNHSTVENFLNYKNTRPDHFYNMIEGLISEGARGRIYKDWKPIPDTEFDALPYESFYGLDFGFTNDPTALVEIKKHNRKVWFKELLYETGLTNRAIARRLSELGVSRSARIYADSSEPKSIEEIFQEDWNILPALKGTDSVTAGIDMMLDFEVCYTESSTNIAKESQNYKWALDRNKEPTNTPVDKDNHLMDASRYGVFTDERGAFVGFA